MTWAPTHRYSAVAVFSGDLERVVLIHKLRPLWQVGKANFPGGKVEDKDDQFEPCRTDYWFQIHLRCAVRELAEETGLVIDAAALKLFCTLRFRSREGDDGEVQFFAVVGDVDKARTMESERVFVQDIDVFFFNGQAFDFQEEIVDDINDPEHGRRRNPWLPTMSNLPWLTAMARQTLCNDSTDTAPPFIVYEGNCL